MGAQRPYVVYGFASTHDALTAEAVLTRTGLSLTVMPTPKALGELCGIALRLAEEDVERAETALAEAGIAWSASLAIFDR